MPKQENENNATLKAAKDYVARQLATMKEHGATPKLSASDVKDIVRQVAEASK